MIANKSVQKSDKHFSNIQMRMPLVATVEEKSAAG